CPRREPSGEDVPRHLRPADARERQAEGGGELTREGLHERNDPRGKNQRGDLCADAPRGPRGVLDRSAGGTYSPTVAADPADRRSPCSRVPRLRAARSWRARRLDTVTYTAHSAPPLSLA